ncbi:hypothetical protein ACOTWR_06395 [Aliarcobacter butzleri]
MQEETNNSITLTEDEVDFFLKKIDVAKLGDRISKQFDIKDLIKFREFLNLPIEVKLSEPLLIKAYKENNISNKILTDKEKISLKELYSSDFKSKIDKRKKKQENQTNAIHKMIDQLIINSENLIYETKELIELSIKQRNKITNCIKNIDNTLSGRNYLTIDDIRSLEKSKLTLSRILRKPTYANQNERSRAFKERQLAIKYLQNMQKIKEQREREIIERINNRKNKAIEAASKNDDSIRKELIVVEAYTEDFCSEKSRFALSVLHCNNIKISFYNGIIKLINEDINFNKIEFNVSQNILNFINENSDTKIEIPLDSNEIIINTLEKQSTDKEFINKILDCLSILYYINTFYSEKEKIEITVEDIEQTPTPEQNENRSKKTESVVYLSNKNIKKVKTIKIKKGKRGISGSFIIRGHWRRQKYTDGVKLIWIEPFWKGKGKAKLKTYKII